MPNAIGVAANSWKRYINGSNKSNSAMFPGNGMFFSPSQNNIAATKAGLKKTRRNRRNRRNHKSRRN